MSYALGLLIVRIVVGLLMMAHGSQKLFGWVGGHGFIATQGMLKSKGFRPAWFWALVGGLGEFGGGLLLALGFLSPLGAVAIFASMLMVILKFHFKDGLLAPKGFEYPFVILVLSFLAGLVGPGNYSLDALLGIALPTWIFWVVLVIAIIVDLIGLITSRQHQAAQQATA
ncbi:MAG TPA: DoxX family protein [Ktedonobacteraceae bacterium]|jgi:putative oxidoreductase|nr:DoxX family protein [Ktedonobacteraceae bacterium]